MLKAAEGVFNVVRTYLRLLQTFLVLLHVLHQILTVLFANTQQHVLAGHLNPVTVSVADVITPAHLELLAVVPVVAAPAPTVVMAFVKIPPLLVAPVVLPIAVLIVLLPQLVVTGSVNQGKVVLVAPNAVPLEVLVGPVDPVVVAVGVEVPVLTEFVKTRSEKTVIIARTVPVSVAQVRIVVITFVTMAKPVVLVLRTVILQGEHVAAMLFAKLAKVKTVVTVPETAVLRCHARERFAEIMFVAPPKAA